jgi:cytochrome c553
MQRRFVWALFTLTAASGCELFDFGMGDDYEPYRGADYDYPEEEPATPVLPEPAPAPERLWPTTWAEQRPPAISGGTLAVSPEGTHAVIADSDRDQVYVIDLATRTMAVQPLARGAEPGRVTFDAAGGVHVVLRGGGALARLDLATSTLRETPVCALPRGVAYDAGGDRLLVACASGELVALAPTDHRELSRVFIDRDLRDVAMHRSGDVLVSRFRSTEVVRLRADAITARTSPPPVTRLRALNSFFDAQGNEVVLPPEVHKSPTLAYRMVTAPDGDVVMLHQRAQDDEVVQIPGANYYGAGCDSIMEAAISRIDAEGQIDESGGIYGVAQPVDAAISPDANWLVLAVPSAWALGTQSTVQVFNRALVAEPPVEGSCDGFAVAEGDLEAQAVAVAFDRSGQLLVQSREPAQLDIYTLEGAEAGFPSLHLTVRLPLADSSVRDTGHDLFHADVGTALTCGSCHPEGGDDGHTWVFAEAGERRTQSIAGGILATAPFHWSGDLPDFRHLVDEVMVGRMGSFEMNDEHTQALAEWIDAQPAAQLAPRDVAAVERGKQLFDSAETACASCHTGPALTNNASVDVGTGGLFQVPSLRGLAMRAPFMHDGCAETLRARFDTGCGGATHGNIAGLSDTDVDDLVAYLETL